MELIKIDFKKYIYSRKGLNHFRSFTCFNGKIHKKVGKLDIPRLGFALSILMMISPLIEIGIYGQ
jgi:hypothetical protein